MLTCREVLVMVMRKHQRYFPVYEASGEALLPHFITVANGQIDVPTVRTGMPLSISIDPVKHSLLHDQGHR